MAILAPGPQPFSQQMLARARRFMHWLTKPHIVLSLIMLVALYFMVIIPLYRMVETTLTWQPRDVVNNPGAVVGEFTLYHYIRMLTGTLGKIYMSTPVKHSIHNSNWSNPFIAPDRWIASVVGGTNKYARQETCQPIGFDPVHHAFLDSGASLACVLQEHKLFRRHSGCF